MTYIDKDKALNLDFKINVSLFESRRKTAERAVQAYADAISKIPAADVRPVVRGEWEWEMYQYTPYCSICGGAGFPGPANGKRYNFCPHCGANMREEDSGEQ